MARVGGLWSLLWVYDVRLPSPEETTNAQFIRFARFAAPGTAFPAIAALFVTSAILRESWRTTALDTLGRKRFFLWSWLLFPALVAITILLTVALRLAHFDPNLTYARRMLPASALSSAHEMWHAYLAIVATQLAIVPLANVLIPGMGEELGWRGFLQPRLTRSGFGVWPSMIITGAIWGLWHAPVMIRGQYPGHPYVGAVLTIPYCVLLAIIFGWLRNVSGSVWVAAVAHASLDISTSDGVATLAPGFDFAVVGGLESIVGWVVLSAFVGWLIASGRLPSPFAAGSSSLEAEASTSKASSSS